MREFMEPLLKWIEYAGTITDRKEVFELWNKCLEHMDYAIYVNLIMTEDEIVNGLRHRFRIDRVPVVFVFGRTGTINTKIKKSIERFLEEESEYQVDIVEYEIDSREFVVGDHVALTAIIRVKTKDECEV